MPLRDGLSNSRPVGLADTERLQRPRRGDGFMVVPRGVANAGPGESKGRRRPHRVYSRGFWGWWGARRHPSGLPIERRRSPGGEGTPADLGRVRGLDRRVYIVLDITFE